MKRAALSAWVIASAGCVLSDDPVSYPLRDGPYYASWEALVANDCFEDGLPIPRGYTLVLQADVEGRIAEVRWPTISDALVPMAGEIAGDGAFELTGFAPHVLTSACTLGVTNRLTGMGISKGLAIYRLTTTFDAGLTPANDCSAFAGETVDGLPFPELSNAANGSCSFTVEGVAHLGSRWYP